MSRNFVSLMPLLLIMAVIVSAVNCSTIDDHDESDNIVNTQSQNNPISPADASSSFASNDWDDSAWERLGLNEFHAALRDPNVIDRIKIHMKTPELKTRFQSSLSRSLGLLKTMVMGGKSVECLLTFDQRRLATAILMQHFHLPHYQASQWIAMYLESCRLSKSDEFTETPIGTGKPFDSLTKESIRRLNDDVYAERKQINERMTPLRVFLSAFIIWILTLISAAKMGLWSTALPAFSIGAFARPLTHHSEMLLNFAAAFLIHHSCSQIFGLRNEWAEGVTLFSITAFLVNDLIRRVTEDIQRERVRKYLQLNVSPPKYFH